MGGAEVVRSELTLCPGTNCLTWTMPGKLCEDCWAFRRPLLARLTVNWYIAHSLLAPSSTPGEHVTGGSGPASRPPLDIHVFAALEAALAVVIGWASRIRERRGASPLPGLSSARATWLFDHAMPELLESDSSLSTKERIEYYADLYRIHRLLRLVVHEAPRESEHVDVACPECGRMTIVMTGHGDRAVCLTCHGAWSEAAWYALLSAIRTR